MRPAFYSVTIVNSGLNTSAPSDGFIDPTRIEAYMASGSSPTTMTHSTAKRRANRRWVAMFEKISQVCNVYVDPASIIMEDNNATTAPSEITFTVQVDAGAEALHTENESSPGTFLTGEAALERLIARMMVAEEIRLLDIYDPTETAAPNSWNENEQVRRSVTVLKITVGKLANSLTDAASAITVTAI